MPAGHLLPHVQQQCIVAGLLNVDGCLEDMAFAHFALSTLSRCHVYYLLLTCALTFCQLHALLARVKLGESVVIPQYAVALARYQHRNAYLGVHLCQAARQAPHVAIAVLELAQSEQELILRRIKRQRCLARCQLMISRTENSVAGLILYSQLVSIYLGRDISLLQLIVLHIEPIGQVALGIWQSISHTYGILSYISYRELLRSGRYSHHAEKNS